MFSAVKLVVLLLCVNVSIQDEEKNSELVHGMKELTLIKRSVVYPSDDPTSDDVCNQLSKTPNSVCTDVRSCLNYDRRERICGWNGRQPMVCCIKRKKTSSELSSNLECGIPQNVSSPARTRVSKRSPEPLEREFDIDPVVGGQEVRPFSYTWMAALDKATYGPNHRLLCGASLISPRHILTAAHCFQKDDNKTPEKFSIRLRAHNVNSGTRYGIQTITIHPDYDFVENYDDIAVLTLEKEVPVSRSLLPICLPEAELSNRAKLTGQSAMVLGWGHTSYGGINSRVLQQATVPIVDTAECNSIYKKIPSGTFSRGITNNFLCAGLEEGGKDACQNDSGGPLQIKDGNRFVQVGIVSFGYGCAEPGYPGVYTRVGPYVPWINRVMQLTVQN